MGDREDLGDYLDRLIYRIYGATQRGYGYVSKHPPHSDFIEHIEDETTGRPHPIDDAADHYLLRAFDNVRRDLQAAPVPQGSGSFGDVRRFGGSFPGTFPCNETHGELPWRCLHGDPGWPCVECGHPPSDHRGGDCASGAYRDEEGRLCYPCNCGNNCGR